MADTTCIIVLLSCMGYVLPRAHYGLAHNRLAVAYSPYVGIARKQDGGSNQCLHSDNFAVQQML